MKKFILLAFTAALSLGASAQGYQGNPSDRLTNGFYRVQNVASGRYAYVNDNTGGININNTSADMGAVTLSKTDVKDPYCDPASVCYVKKVAHKHDVIGQNTSLYGFINHYVQFQDASDGKSYLITPLLRTPAGQETNIYLSDGAANSPYGTTYVEGKSTKEDAKEDNKYWWNMIPMDFAGDEYLGIKPDASMQAGDKYYKPYIVGFDMQLSAGMKAYYVTEIKTDASHSRDAVIIAEYAGDVVPANMPVIIECSSASASDNRVTLLNGEGSLYTPAADNKLIGQYFCNENHGNAGDAYRAFNATSNRVLAVVDGKLAYVTGEEALKHTTVLTVLDKYGDESEANCINANESFLTGLSGYAENLPVMTAKEYEAWKNNGLSVTFPDIVENDKLDVQDVNLPVGIAAMILQMIPEKYHADVNRNGSVSIGDLCKLIDMLVNGQTTLGTQE